MKTSPSNPLCGVTRLFITLVVLATASLRLSAQLPATEENAQPYKIGTIAVRFVGVANVSEQVVRANMQIREGAELNDTYIDRDIRSLYKTGLFEFIEVKREVLPDRVVNLAVEVTPKYRILTVRFEGTKKVKPHRLEKEIKSKTNESLDERQVKEDAEKIKEYYQKNGYNQATINYVVERDRTTGFGTIIFKINEGAKVKISDIRFIGNNNVKAHVLWGHFDGPLIKAMETRRYWWLSWLTGTGRLKDEVFEDDLDKLRDYYREQGYLDVEIPQDKIIYDYPTPKKLVLTIQIEEGRQYKVGEITFTGNKLHSSRMLKRLVKQKTGMIFTPSKIDKDVETLEDFYGKDGYLETRIHPNRKPNIATGNIDLEYEVNESEKFYVESIHIEGNTKTKSLVILRELTLGPGEVFNSVRMKISKMRLENTRFFSDQNLSPETTNIPGRRNLKVSVKEDRTGNLSFGAGYSSLEKLVFFAEVTQSNFDILNRKSFFQGDGQKFRLRLQTGSYSKEITLSFEEPWVMQKQLALGFEFFHTSSNYDNQYYNLMRTGGTVYLRKRLFELVEGTLSYTFEKDKISDVSSSNITAATNSSYQISKVGFQLLRDTRDKIVNTTSGNRIEFNTNVAGGYLKGDLDYYSLELRTSQFLPIFEAQEQVIAIIARGGVVNGYGRTRGYENYYFEGFYLGGPYSLRGFENRDVGPKNSGGYPIGGKSYGFLSIEYSADIVSPVRFAIFYDAGFVNFDAYDFNPINYNDNFGFGLRMFVAGAPLSLDYGIPLTTDKYNKKGGQFNFSFGTRF
ncbi:MAG: outer membrane protein assembly factor BamA [Nibricoccus sp.]